MGLGNGKQRGHFVAASFLLCLGALPACKTRNADAPGLVTDGTGVDATAVTTDAKSEPAQNFGDIAPITITCRPLDGVTGQDSFIFHVRGGRAAAAPEPLTLTIERGKAAGAPAQVLNRDIDGRGIASKDGQLFLAFQGGALTADANAVGTSSATHSGVLTLDSDADAQGVPVDCNLQTIGGTPQPASP